LLNNENSHPKRSKEFNLKAVQEHTTEIECFVIHISGTDASISQNVDTFAPVQN